MERKGNFKNGKSFGSTSLKCPWELGEEAEEDGDTVFNKET